MLHTRKTPDEKQAGRAVKADRKQAAKAAKAGRKADLAAWRQAHPMEAALAKRMPLWSCGKIESGRLKGHPVAGARAEVYDRTGSRHTLTRAVTVVGAFTKKQTGHVTLVLTCPDGYQHTERYQPYGLDLAVEYANLFNAYASQLAAEASPVSG